jgi:siroheme synthase-like protein
MSVPSLFPVFLDLRDVPCLVAGAGPVGTRRVRRLLAAGARVVWVSLERPRRPFRAGKRLRFRLGPYRPSDLRGVRLAFACTSDRVVNARLALDSHRLGIWVNRADRKHSDFQMPASVTRGGVTAAFSTGGRSPALARRHRLEWARRMSRVRKRSRGSGR